VRIVHHWDPIGMNELLIAILLIVVILFVIGRIR